jgi:hypothetical protein
MLEEAYLYNSLAQLKHSTGTTWGEFQIELQEFRKKASDANFPVLMGLVNAGLNDTLHFEREFRSLQKVRNCLEHRNGVVSGKTSTRLQIR